MGASAGMPLSSVKAFSIWGIDRGDGTAATGASLAAHLWLAQRLEFAHNRRASMELIMQRTRAVAIAAEQQARQGLILLAAALLLPALLLLLISP